MVDKPSGQEIVIVRVQVIFPPSFPAKTVQKPWIDENLRPNGICPARHAGSPSVKIVRSRDLKIASMDIACT
jgi:hypothetical protein